MIGPVVAPVGTVAIISVVELVVKLASTPLNRTAVGLIKFVPVMVTAVPDPPAPGENVLMVGDDIEADVRGAMAAGLPGAMVRTGKFRPADLESEPRPDLVMDSVADLPRYWPG